MSEVNFCSMLRYEPDSGLFFWIEKSGTRRANSIAGTKDRNGYIVITIDKKPYRAHRLAWLFLTGEFPDAGIDHINRIRDDNRASNLRLATTNQNQHNTGLSSNNKSGFKGVYFNKRDSKYHAQIMIDKRRISLGLHDTAEQAGAAYLAASEKYYGEFSPK